MQASGGGSLAEGSSVDGEGSLDGQARHARSARSSQALGQMHLVHCCPSSCAGPAKQLRLRVLDYCLWGNQVRLYMCMLGCSISMRLCGQLEMGTGLV